MSQLTPSGASIQAGTENGGPDAVAQLIASPGKYILSRLIYHVDILYNYIDCEGINFRGKIIRKNFFSWDCPTLSAFWRMHECTYSWI